MKNISIDFTPRQLEKTLKSLVTQFPAVVVTGPRQSGKSTLLKKLFSPEYQYVTFDDPVKRETALRDPRFFLESLGEKVILDEIQYVPHLTDYLKILIDEDRSKRGRFILTGSQQFSMMKTIGDSLAGRVAVTELLPFSHPELKQALNSDPHYKTPADFFTHAILRGSYPEPALDTTIERDAWYGSYLQTYLERDIRSIYNIGHLREFQNFLKLLAGRAGQILNLNSLSVEAGVTVPTLKNWVSILEASRLIYLLPPYYRNLGKRITKSPKIYFLDLGLLGYLLSIEKVDFESPMAGALYENFVVAEAVKAQLHAGKRPSLYFYRTYAGLEIDLLVEKGQRLYPVEIKATKTPRMKMGEPMSLLSEYDKIHVQPGQLITLSEVSQPLSRTLSVQNIDDFLAWLVNL